MTTAQYYPSGRFWAVCILLAALALGPHAPVAAAQGQPRTFTGDVTIAGSIPGRFLATVGPDGRAVAYLTATDDAGNPGSSMRFVGRLDGNRIRAVATDGTTLSGTVHGGRVVGTVGSVGWTGVVNV